jgi:predicted nuclease with TOPRIM domain
MSENQAWDNYSKLILQQLETLTKGVEALREDLQAVKQDLIQLKAREDRVNELKIWKDRIDEVISPPQLKELVTEVDELVTFKIKAITIFVVIQAIMGLILAFLEFF